MRRMQKRIKRKSLKIYMLCILGRLPTWVQHPGSISKHGASPVYTQPFYTEKTTKVLWLHGQHLFLFYLVQIMSYISTERGTIWYFCTSWCHLCFSRSRHFLTPPVQQPHVPLLHHSGQRRRKEVSPEQNTSRDGSATTPGPSANLKHLLPFSFSILVL